MKDFLKDEKEQKDFNFDNVLEKGRNPSVKGPLSKTWTAGESVKLLPKDSVEFDFKENQTFIE